MSSVIGMLMMSFRYSTLEMLARGNQDSSILMFVTMELGYRGREVFGSMGVQEGFEVLYVS